MMSVGGYHEYTGGYDDECRGDIMSTLGEYDDECRGDIMSTPGDVQY